MFVYSVKRNQLKLFLIVVFVIVSVLVIAFLAKNGKTEEVSADKKISVAASDEEQRLGFLSQFGWEVDKDSAQVTEVIIPEEFDESYSSYNELQLRQGFDLTQFAGKRVKKWSYTVTNYPGYENKICIRANLFVSDGKVIGGDICSVELDGFMHTFDMNNANEKQKT
ncbi:MAG: DUF4830 domain-containing protein [Clostridiales bacterium]|nr:DUF4830 domain-containing protein [Clostridia bacterium]MCR4564415.1 DUF4830 domain-containing protein [Clostridiales bacterium]